MKNPEKQEGNFRIFNFAGKRVKISIREGYFCIQNDYDWHGNTIKC